MKPGISTYSYPWSFKVGEFAPPRPYTFKDLLLAAQRKSIQFVEFGDNYPLHLLPATELNSLKQAADQLEINLQVGTRGLTVTNIRTYVTIAKMIGSPFLRIVIDDEGCQPTEAEVIEIIITLIPLLQQENVQLLIENHDRFKSQALKRIVESTNPEWIGICLDTANSLGAGEGITEVAEVLSPYTGNLHIKDFRIERKQHKMGFLVQGCIAGEGILDIPWLLKEVGRHGRCKTAILEVWSDPGTTLEETLVKEQEWADKSIDYLKTLIK